LDEAVQFALDLGQRPAIFVALPLGSEFPKATIAKAATKQARNLRLATRCRGVIGFTAA
jgi:hypothetical protein